GILELRFFTHKDRGSLPPPLDEMQLAIVAVGESSLFLHHRSSFINGQRSAVPLLPVELGDSLVGVFRTHGNESEALGPSSIAVGNDAHGFDGSNLRKQTVKVFLSCLKREISNVN